MKHVRVTITAGGREAEIHPMYDVMANAPFVDRATALQWNFTGDALGILHYVEGDIDALRDAMDGIPEVLGYDVEPAGPDACYAYVRDATTGSLRDLFGPLTLGGIVVVPPIVYRTDGRVVLSLFGPDEEIQAGVERIPDPVDLEIESVSGLSAVPSAAETRLSERQREAVEAALELGYYAIPRECSHEDVADAIDCAPSTAAEHLRKAESAVLYSTFRPFTTRNAN